MSGRLSTNYNYCYDFLRRNFWHGSSRNLSLFSPLRSTIEGPLRESVEESQFATALEACKQLREIQELDEHWMPLGRENSKIPKIIVTTTESQQQHSNEAPQIQTQGPKPLIGE